MQKFFLLTTVVSISLVASTFVMADTTGSTADPSAATGTVATGTVTTTGTTTGEIKTGICAAYRASLQGVINGNKGQVKANRSTFSGNYGYGFAIKNYTNKKLTKEQQATLKKAIQTHKTELKKLYEAKKQELKKIGLSGAEAILVTYKDALIAVFTSYATTLRTYVDPAKVAEFDAKVAARIKLYNDNFALRIQNIQARQEFRADCFSTKAQKLAKEMQKKIQKIINSTKKIEQKTKELQKMLDTLNKKLAKAKGDMVGELQAQILVVQNTLTTLTTTTLSAPTTLAE